MNKVNDWFKCINCWNNISPANRTCRNHCNYCFVSVHVDDKIPWDRWSECEGIMYPIHYFISNWLTKVTFKCIKCWKNIQNKLANDDYISKLDECIEQFKIFTMK